MVFVLVNNSFGAKALPMAVYQDCPGDTWCCQNGSPRPIPSSPSTEEWKISKSSKVLLMAEILHQSSLYCNLGGFQTSQVVQDFNHEQ